MYEDIVLSTRFKRDAWNIIGVNVEQYLAHQAGLCKILKNDEGDVEARVWVYSVDMGRVMKEIIGLVRAAGVDAPAFKSRTFKWTF